MVGHKLLALSCALGAMAAPAFSAPPSTKESKKVIAHKRDKYHRILDSAVEPDNSVHLAFGELGVYGDESSIPHLISALRLFPDRELSGNVGMICTQAHCVHDLEQLTGVKVGVSFSSWKAWWENSHPGQPLPVRADKQH